VNDNNNTINSIMNSVIMRNTDAFSVFITIKKSNLGIYMHMTRSS
jgi:hypothetical protein